MVEISNLFFFLSTDLKPRILQLTIFITFLLMSGNSRNKTETESLSNYNHSDQIKFNSTSYFLVVTIDNMLLYRGKLHAK